MLLADNCSGFRASTAVPSCSLSIRVSALSVSVCIAESNSSLITHVVVPVVVAVLFVLLLVIIIIVVGENNCLFHGVNLRRIFISVSAQISLHWTELNSPERVRPMSVRPATADKIVSSVLGRSCKWPTVRFEPAT